MPLLIIPDVHNHTEAAERWIAQFPADRVLFLGDYFDSFGDNPKRAEATADWLVESLSKPGRIHLWGNHDLPYAFPRNIGLFCSGFSLEKSKIVSRILNWEDHWSKLKMVHFEGELAFSHAGISRRVFASEGGPITQGEVETRCNWALSQCLKSDDFADEVFALNGIVWQRWYNMDWLPEFHQVVGHTPMRHLAFHQEYGRMNLCLDSFGQYLGWLDDDGLSYIETATGRREHLGAV